MSYEFILNSVVIIKYLKVSYSNRECYLFAQRNKNNTLSGRVEKDGGVGIFTLLCIYTSKGLETFLITYKNKYSFSKLNPLRPRELNKYLMNNYIYVVTVLLGVREGVIINSRKNWAYKRF